MKVVLKGFRADEVGIIQDVFVSLPGCMSMYVGEVFRVYKDIIADCDVIRVIIIIISL